MESSNERRVYFMNKEDLIKCIVESLEKGLVENLEYDFPSINV